MKNPTYVRVCGSDMVIGTPYSVCVICGQRDRPVLVDGTEEFPKQPDVKAGICEPCARLAEHAWRRVSNVDVGEFINTEPTAVIVYVCRPKYAPFGKSIGAEAGSEEVSESSEPVIDGSCPQEVLMIGRKNSPDDFGLPGGKVELGETVIDAAVRELHEETGLLTWPAALELLHEGYSPRGRSVRAYRCRAYAGEAATQEGEEPISWRPRDPGEHSKLMVSYYRGLDLAIEATRKISSGATIPYVHQFGRAGREYMDLWTARGGKLSADDVQYMMGLRHGMTDEAQMLIDHITKVPT